MHVIVVLCGPLVASIVIGFPSPTFVVVQAPIFPILGVTPKHPPKIRETANNFFAVHGSFIRFARYYATFGSFRCGHHHWVPITYLCGGPRTHFFVASHIRGKDRERRNYDKIANNFYNVHGSLIVFARYYATFGRFK